MKLQHLAIGARFEYDGVIYVKTGPLTATGETGGQKLIPRYAMLKPLDVAPAESKAPVRGRLEAVRVRAAFERFHDCCARLVPEAGQQELAEARQVFLDSIK